MKRASISFEVLEERMVMSVADALDDYEAWRQTTFTVATEELVSFGIPTDEVSIPSLETGLSEELASMDAKSSQLIGLTQMQQAYPNLTGAGYSVVVIDTGINYLHPHLGGSFGTKVIAGWDFVDNDSDPMDLNGHGTHVAGIIAGTGSTYPGIAPDANLIALRVLNASGSGTFGDVEDALQWVMNHRQQYNIVAVNLSLGAGNFTYNPYTFLEDEFTSLRNNGVFTAVASGNSYYSYGSQQGLSYPATSPNVVSVGAVWSGNFGSVSWSSGARDYTTAADRITSFTQRSSQLDLLAPGAILTSTYLGSGYASMAGTSMASPVAAAAAVLVRQALDAAGRTSQANQDGILSILQSTGKTIIDGDDENDNVVNTGLSFKRINLLAAIDSITPAVTPIDVDLPFIDTFTGTSGSSLTGEWKGVSGIFTHSGNKAQVSSASVPALAVLNGVSEKDVAVTADVDVRASGSRAAGLVARYSGPADSNHYLGLLLQSNGQYTAMIYRSVNGVFTLLGSASASTGVGRLTFTVQGSSLKLFLNDINLVSVIDTAITAAGSVGMRGTVTGTLYDNFGATAIAPPPASVNATLPFSESFTTANSLNLPGEWSQRTGSFGILDQKAYVSSSSAPALAVLNGVSQQNVSVSADVDVRMSGSRAAGLIARYSGPGDNNHYLGLLLQSNGEYFAMIYRSVGGVFTLLGSANAGSGAGRLRFDVQGTSLRLYLNDVNLVSVTDSAISAAGSVGLRGTVLGTSYDNFAATVLAAPPAAVNATLPFSDNFSVANSSTLPAEWKQVVGLTTVSSQQALVSSSSAPALSVLNGISVKDVSVSADVNVLASGARTAGLVARYSGSGDTNHYVGLLLQNNGQFTAMIYRSVGGVWTLLGSAAASTGSGTLRFDVQGSSLKLYLNGVNLVSVVDTAITTAGSVGMRGTYEGTRFDNFAAETLAPAAPPVNATLPYSQFFNQTGALAGSWVTQQGSFVQTGSGLAVQSFPSIASLAGISERDVLLTANVDVSASGSRAAGLIARYGGNGDSNFYLGLLLNNNGQQSLMIFRNVGGTFTLLGSRAVSAAGGQLQFQVVGTSLMLTLNGGNALAVTDNAITGPGTVGMRGTVLGTMYYSFAAQTASGSSVLATSAAEPAGTVAAPRATSLSGTRNLGITLYEVGLGNPSLGAYSLGQTSFVSSNTFSSGTSTFFASDTRSTPTNDADEQLDEDDVDEEFSRYEELDWNRQLTRTRGATRR